MQTSAQNQVLNFIQQRMAVLLTDANTRHLISLLQTNAPRDYITNELQRLLGDETMPHALAAQLRILQGFIGTIETQYNNYPPFQQVMPNMSMVQPGAMGMTQVMSTGILLFPGMPAQALSANISKDEVISLVKQLHNCITANTPTGVSPTVLNEIQQMVGAAFMDNYQIAVMGFTGFLLQLERQLSGSGFGVVGYLNIRIEDSVLDMADTLLTFCRKVAYNPQPTPALLGKINTMQLRRPITVGRCEKAWGVAPSSELQMHELFQIAEANVLVRVHGETAPVEKVSIQQLDWRDVVFIWENLEDIPFTELGFTVQFTA